MSNHYKEVYYNQYCKTCKHEKESDADDPCDECLDTPVNVDSHKPINFEEKIK